MNRLEFIQDKILSVENAKKRIQTWKLKGDKIVFTNGCFDILHQGHVTYLAQSAAKGNRMVIGLNTDASVKRQGKGDDRPVNNQDSRAILIAALGFVDAVVFFDKDTPLDLIKDIEPSVLAKGADYDPDETDENSKKYIVGSKEVKGNGGKVYAIPLIEGFSTTSIIEKLRK